MQITNIHVGEDFYDMDDSNTTLNIFDLDFYQFRLKPRTISINGIEVPAPFEPKDGEKCFVIDTEQDDCFYEFTFYENSGAHKKYIHLGAWCAEEEIKQVVAALRSIFKGE